MKLAFNVLGCLSVVAFASAFVVGFTVDMSPPGSSVNCGAPFGVIDGDFAAGVPDHLKAACQDEADRRSGMLFIPSLALFMATIVIGSVLFRRGEWPWGRPRP